MRYGIGEKWKELAGQRNEKRTNEDILITVKEERKDDKSFVATRFVLFSQNRCWENILIY